jgi:DNA-binding HxlR family transcriptional regulator
MDYGQFCPVSKAVGILGEKWTLLIVRDLLAARSRRFRDFQRGMPKISPTVLAKRLDELCEVGLLLRKKIPGRRGHEYFLTDAGRDLGPVVAQLGTWGMKWGRGQLSDFDLDVYVIMVAIETRIEPARLIGRETVLHFEFTDIDEAAEWWLVIAGDDVDLCLEDPGKEVDVYFVSDLRTMTEIYMGDISLAQARRSGRLKVSGSSPLVRTLKSWFQPSVYAGSRAKGDLNAI